MDNVDNNGGGSNPTAAIDAGTKYTDKTVSVSRDGKPQGQISIRFYNDMPSVPYISVADFHKVITNGETMKVARQANVYELTTKYGTGIVDVKDDYLYSTSYAGLTNLMWMVDATVPPNVSYDGSKYLKFVKVDAVSSFKPVSGTRLDFKKYGIDLHDDGTNVYCPFATLADMYADGNMHMAACHDDKVLVSTKEESLAMRKTDPEFCAKPYQKTEVTADMARYRYQELCFVLDNFFGYPGRTIMEKAGMGEKGFDATLEAVENGKVVKRLLQSTNNMDFAWGTIGLQYLLFDGGHTNVRTMLGAPESIRDEYTERVMAAETRYPEVSTMYQAWQKTRNERYELRTKLEGLREQSYGDVLYKVNSQKTTAVVIINSFNDMDEDAWTKYYSSQKSDADWQELLTHYKKDNFIGFLYALLQAKADGVKNLVLDISQNGGGSTDIVVADVAVLRKNRKTQLWSQNVMEGKNLITTFLLDANFDGVFDEKDDTNPKIDCSSMNVSVLSSKLAFSCGNVFPAVMKDYGYPIIGERSGGGPCSIQGMVTPDGFQYIISTYRDRSTDKDFNSIDNGITTTDGYSFDYSLFYDLDFLTTKMQELFKK